MPLTSYIKKIIQQNGFINIASFMQEALCHSTHGYYMKQDPFGRDGDFTTAPEISQMFGELIGAWAANYWTHFSNKDIQIVELGPGRGTLMSDLLRSTKNIPDFHGNIDIKLLEISPALKQIQKNNLSEYDSKVSWIDSLDQLEAKPTIFIANEFFDALPIQQFIKTDSSWFERKIGIIDNELVFISDHKSPLSTKFDEQHKNAKTGAVLEISPASSSVMQIIANHTEKHGGGAVIIDYGYTENNYLDSLQALKDHKYSNILENIGDSDITAHVDFASLKHTASNFNINTYPIITQKEFLEFLGITQRSSMLMKNATKKQQDDINSALHRLTDKSEMGELFKVMIIDKVI